MIVTIHILFALLLFFIQNKIGARAYSKGYVKFSLLDEKDEALSVNFVIKVFGPVIYLILLSAALQYFGLSEYLPNVINVIYYYLVIRIIVIVLYERLAIVNWGKIFVYYFTIILISRIFYTEFIDKIDILLPDFTTIKNEIWLLIILFVYQLGNGFEEKVPNNQIQETTLAYLPELKPRKKRYILNKSKLFNRKYNSIINRYLNDDNFNVIVISILIYENFNRPRFVRLFEYLWVAISRRFVTQGIMQISSNEVLSDFNSVEKGVKNLSEKYFEFLEGGETYYPFISLVKTHCPDRKYIRQILFISKCIIDSSNNKKDYNKLYSEIRQEFSLYS